MLKISPILSHIRKPIYTGHNTTCPLKPLQKDVFTRSGEISFSSLQAPTEEEIKEKSFFETTIQKNGEKIQAYVLLKKDVKDAYVLTLYTLEPKEKEPKNKEPRELGKLWFYICKPEQFGIPTKYEPNEDALYVHILTRLQNTEAYKGIGTALLKSAFKISQTLCTEGRMCLLACDLDKNNKKHPVYFYEQFGFVVIETKKDRYHMYLPAQEKGKFEECTRQDTFKDDKLTPLTEDFACPV